MITVASNIKEDYYELVPVEPKIPEWKVYFDGNFWGRHGRERAGKKISLDEQFVWDDEVWHIPAIYTCSKGLVVDFCIQVSDERIRSFMDKWNLSIENDGTDFTYEQRMQIYAENPLAININPKVVLNGTVLSGSHCCGESLNPCFPEGNGLEAKSVTQYYGLDPTFGYCVNNGYVNQRNIVGGSYAVSRSVIRRKQFKKRGLKFFRNY